MTVLPKPGTREDRRVAFAKERKARATGVWGPWESAPLDGLPSSIPGGWLEDIHTVYRNGWCCVLVRDLKTDWGIVKHFTVQTALEAELGWAEKQRIKNELFGKDAVAVEVYPAQARVIDQADMYHMWVLPAGKTLPFGIGKGDSCSFAHYRPVPA